MQSPNAADELTGAAPAEISPDSATEVHYNISDWLPH